MAYNPYALADTFTQLAESGLEAKRMGQQSRIGTGLKKQDIKKEYTGMLEEADRKAQEALAKERARASKRTRRGRGFLKKLVSAFLPGVGAAWAGIDAAREGKKAGKHAFKQAELAKKYATQVDPTGRFKNLFTGDALSAYKGEAEKTYGGILSEAKRRKEELSDPMKMLSTALTTGVTQYGAGKAMQAGMEGLKGLKPLSKGEGIISNVKDLKKAGISGETFKDILKFPTPTDTPIDVSSITQGIDPKMIDLIKKLGPETAGGIDIAALLDAKSPLFKLLKESAGKSGKYGREDPLGLFGKGEDQADLLTGLLRMLQ